MHNEAHNNWRTWAIGLAIVVFLIPVYFLTYRGYAISRDEWFLFDATESMARRGTLERNYEFDASPPLSLQMMPPSPADTEPLQPVLASGLFLLAQAVPDIGLAHTVWLFNVLITALTAGVVYAFGLNLGYQIRVAAVVALIFGLGTIAWPYSRTYFREPLFTLLALLAVYLVMIIRRRLEEGRHIVWAGAAFILALVGALLSKEVSILLIPALAIEVLPARLKRVRFSRQTIIRLTILLILVILMIALTLTVMRPFILRRYAFTTRLEQLQRNLSGADEGIRGYMFSPGRSIWLYSPVLLLGFWGIGLLARMRRWRQIALPLVVVSTFTVVYAAVRGVEQWTGGFGWGARYLVPVTPFWILLLLPVITSLFEHRKRWQWVGVSSLVVLSIGLQVLASLVSLQTFYDAQTFGDLAAQDDIWVWERSAIPGYLDLVGENTIIDWAWQYAIEDAWLLPVLCILLTGAALAALAWWGKVGDGTPNPRRAFLFTVTLLPVLTMVTLGGGLYAIRLDPRYSGEFQPARDLLVQLEPQLQDDDVVVLNDPTYAEFFMNYYKRSTPTVYTLPPSPGERYSPEQPLEIESVYGDENIYLTNALTLAYFARQTDRLWLVMNNSRFVPWSTRPVEAYLARHYFPVREVYPSDLARAVLFDMTSAPNVDLRWPEYLVNVTYADQVRLVGYDIPGGAVRQAGDVLPVSLLWEAITPVAHDYTVALFLLASDGSLVAQHDAFPSYYFDPMNTWRTGSLHRDNHGLQLPATLPAGQYELWTVLYFWETPDERLSVTGPDGSLIGDHVGLTPITIEP